MRGHALRYAGWQAWDRALPRVGAAVIIALAILGPLYFGARNDPPGPEQARVILTAMHRQFCFLYVFLFAGGIISQDRTQGWFRFYLAKPVSPTWLYGQQIVLAWLGMAASSVAFIAVFAVTISPVWAWSLVGEAMVQFGLLGMLIVCASPLMKLDWLFGIAVWIASGILRHRFPRADSDFGAALHGILPPTHLLGFSDPLTRTDVAWVAGWAIGLFALTMLLLRLRPLGED